MALAGTNTTFAPAFPYSSILLEFYPPLLGHEHHLFEGVGRWNAAFVFRLEDKPHGLGRARRHTQAAADASIQIDLDDVVVVHG